MKIKIIKNKQPNENVTTSAQHEQLCNTWRRCCPTCRNTCKVCE